jgi:hypothetical protein
MRRRRAVQLALVLVVAGAGCVAYLKTVPVVLVNTSKLSALVLTNPELPKVQPTPAFSQPAPITTAHLPSLAQGFSISPGQTGAYTSEWLGNGGDVTLFLELLPSVTLAKQAQAEQESRNMSSAAMKALKYPVESRFAVPGLPDGAVVHYLIPRSASNQQGVEVPETPITAYTTAFRVDRATIRIDIQGSVATKAAIDELAQREGAILAKLVPSWRSMATTSYPVISSLLCSLIVVLVMALVFFIPFVLDRVHAAQLAREEALRLYRLQTRGSKVTRRRRVRR